MPLLVRGLGAGVARGRGVGCNRGSGRGVGVAAALAVAVRVALGLSVSSSATVAGTIFRRELFLDLGLPSSSISVDAIAICLIIQGTSCRANQARIENPNWNLSLRSFGERTATHLAAKRDGSRKKDRAAVREGLRIGFDVL